MKGIACAAGTVTIALNETAVMKIAAIPANACETILFILISYMCLIDIQ